MNTDVSHKLLDAAAQLFLEKDFHSVSIRELAKGANTSSAMINYYFTNKHNLFEEMIKREYGKILNILDGIIYQQELLDFRDVVANVLKVYQDNPNMPKFIVKTLLFRQGPGSQFLQETFEFEKQLVAKWVSKVIKEGKIDRDVNAEVVRIAFMCLTLLPGMMQDQLKASYGKEGHENFQKEFALFAGDMLMHGVIPRSKSDPKPHS